MHCHPAFLRICASTLALMATTTVPGAGQGSPRGAAAARPLPLEAARNHRFTATAGTWMSLDVSPDGRTIVFDLLGDLYTMPVEGGRATRLTSGLAFDAQPRFSPDGTKIAFVSDRSGGDNLFIQTLDGRDTTQVTQGNNNIYTSPEWSPDGKYLVASRSPRTLGGTARLYLFDVTGGSGIQLTRGPAVVKTSGAAFSPDGRHIWYAGWQPNQNGVNGDWQYNIVFPTYQVFSYDRQTGQTSLMTAEFRSAFRPAVSPDGRWLVYGTRHENRTGLRIRELSTSEERWLAWPVQRDDLESRGTLDVLPGYSFTPDSRAVIAAWDGAMWRIPVDGGRPRRIPIEVEVELATGPEIKFAWRVDSATSFTARQIRNPAVSPDGRRVAFTALGRLYVQDLPDGTPRRVTRAAQGEFHPVWSPDGRSLAWVTWQDGVGGHIMRAEVDGGAEPVRLTGTTAFYYNLAWSPAGDRIVATRGAARDWLHAGGLTFGPLGAEFVWVPSAGGPVSVIAPTGTRDVAHFSRDPSRIYAYSPAEGLVSFRWDGSDVKRHLTVTGVTAPPFGDAEHGERPAMPRRLTALPADVTAVARHPDTGEPTPQPAPAGLVMISPDGTQAIAQSDLQVYLISVPQTGGPPPAVNVTALQGAPVPAKKLTDIGGEFPSWSADGRRVYWSLGNRLVTYDLERARAVEDSTRRARRERADSLRRAAADTAARRDSTRARPDSARRDTTRARPDSGYRPEERRISVTVARDIPRGTVVLRGGRAITMRGAEVIDNADVVVRDNRIVAVGRRGQVSVPGDARIVDVSGRTVLPGFVDAHFHGGLTPEIHTGQHWAYLTNLAYGVTATRDPQTGSTDVLSYGDMVEAGRMLGPRIYSTGPGFFGAVYGSEPLRDLAHARTLMRRYSEYFDTRTLKMYMTGNRQQRQWVAMAAKELGIMPTAEGGLDFKVNLTHALDGYSGVEHNLPVLGIQRDVVELFTASGTVSTPTLLVSYGGPFGENFWYATEEVHGDPKLRRWMPEAHLDFKSRRRGQGAGFSPGLGGWFHPSEHVYPEHARFIRSLVESGGRAGVGAHGQLQGLAYHWELWMLASGGLAPHEVLRMATQYGADAIGLGQDLGSIEPGKLADLVVLDRDPLAQIRNTNSVRYVMKNGRLYDADTLAEVWPEARALPRQWWQEDGPPRTAAGMR